MFGRGRGLVKSRLPNIQVVGKYTTVDEDEPPDVPIQAFGFEDGDQSVSSAFETTFDSGDAEDAAKFLRKAFNILEPASHACKRMPDMEGGYFSHCPRGVPLGKEYMRLRQLMEERAQLELMKDCLFRVKSTQEFVEELEGLLLIECRTVYSIRHGCSSETPVTKLYCLNALCEDLRLHVSHWNSIKQRLNTNRWLQSRLGLLSSQLQHIMHALMSAVHKAVWNLECLIHIGFEVFAHCNVDTLTPEIMWNITRGLEDFNSIVNGLKLSSFCDYATDSDSFKTVPSSFVHDVHLAAFNSSFRRPLEVISFTKILNLLSNEKSKRAAKLTHQFFTRNEHFLRLLNTGGLPQFEWGDYRPHQPQPHSQLVNPDTSDYLTIGSSNTSLNATYLKVGSVRAPDLSNQISPLIEFSRKEQEFAESFLLIVCNSTSLLRKNDPPKSHRSRQTNKEMKTPMSPVVGRPPRAQFQSEGLVMTRSDSQRKTVSWGDNADNSIRSVVVACYMDSLWLHLGQNLDLFLDEPAWQGKDCLLVSSLGSILLFNDTVVTVLRNMIEHVCHKDLFPPTSIQPLLGVVFRLHTLSALGAWDSFVSASLASESSDKCQPYLLREEAYSTRTGKLLIESYSPLSCVLQEIIYSITNTDESNPRANIDLSLCAGVACRIVTLCKLALSWCTSKIQQFTSSWGVNQLLLITHSDLKMLVDCTKKASYLLQNLSVNDERFISRVCDNLAVCQRSLISQQAAHISDHIQSLNGSVMKHFLEKYNIRTLSFLQENFPSARMWKRKIPPDESTDTSPYVVSLVEGLLAPIIKGIDILSTTSQIAIVSMLTVTLCNAWLSFILREKIRFSLWGAEQLSHDFGYLQTQLKRLITNNEVLQSVSELEIFRQMQGIVILLKRQPAQKQGGRIGLENLLCENASTIAQRDPVSMDSLGVSTPSATESSSASGLENGSHKCQRSGEQLGDEDVVATVPNAQEWLALRAVGGSKQWKLSGCFSKASDAD